MHLRSANLTGGLTPVFAVSVPLAAAAENSVTAGQPESRSEALTGADRFWLDTMENTLSIVRLISADRALFLMLSGAVFALQQDMLKARGVDMRNAASFRARMRSILDVLYDIDDANLELLWQERSAQSETTYKTHSVAARMRSTAARVWLLTNYAIVAESFGTRPGSATILNLGVSNLWMMLGAVDADELTESASFFTGSYFSGVRSKPMHPKHWPHRPEIAGDAFVDQ